MRTILKASQIFGNITLDVVFALKRFTEANPKTTLAFLAALDEACDFITTNKAETAEIFARASKVKVSPQEVAQILEDPDSKFSATPHGIMEFVTFMNRAGIMKTKPATWQDLFIRPCASAPGAEARRPGPSGRWRNIFITEPCRATARRGFLTSR